MELCAAIRVYQWRSCLGPLSLWRNSFASSSGGGNGAAGTVFKLTPSGSGWTYSTLYDFEFGGNAGPIPLGQVVVDSQGNLYGTTSTGPYPSPNAGSVFEITP